MGVVRNIYVVASGAKRRCVNQRSRLAGPGTSLGATAIPGEFFPSLLCYKETDPDSWEEYYCLVKPDVCFKDKDSATAAATSHLDAAFAAMHAGGSPVDVGISLRHKGYKKLDQFRVISGENE